MFNSIPIHIVNQFLLEMEIKIPRIKVEKNIIEE